MRMRSSLLAVLLVTPLGAEAQQAPESPRTVASLQAGFASGSMGSNGASLGGTIVTDLSPRLALEATGTYHGQGMGADALSASANLHVLLRPRTERTVPYLTLGGGVYRTSFDMGNARFNGPMNGSAANGAGGYGPGYGMMGGGYGGYGGYGTMGAGYPGSGASNWNYGSMPMFYGSRMGALSSGPDGRPYGQRSFTDPAVSVGAGLRIDLGSRLVLRPDGRALIVLADGDSRTVGVFTLNVGYAF